MGRYSKKTKFIKLLNQDIEDDLYPMFKEAIYKEYILHLKTNSPRWLYDTLISTAEEYWDYMISKDHTLTPEELVTDLGDILDNPITRKLALDYSKITIL